MIIDQFYNIHSLLRVHVRAAASIIAEVDCHLWAFRSDELHDVDIIIAPYCDAPKSVPKTVVDDYEFGGGLYRRDAARFAFSYHGSRDAYYMDRLVVPLNLIVQFALLKKNLTFIHGAGLNFGEEAVIFPAYPGTGKTTLVATFMRVGAKFLGDDLCIVGRDAIYSYPQALSVYPHHLPVLQYSNKHIERAFKRTALLDSLIRPIERSENAIARLVRFALNRARTPAVNVVPNIVFGANAIATRGRASRIISLERAADIVDLSEVPTCLEELADHAVAVLWHEWHASFHNILLYDAVAEGGIGTIKRFLAVRKIVIDSLVGVPCHKVRIPASWDNATLMERFPPFLESLRRRGI